MSKHQEKKCGLKHCSQEASYWVEFEDSTLENATLYLCPDCCIQLAGDEMETINGREVGKYSCDENCLECNS